jgi:integrase
MPTKNEISALANQTNHLSYDELIDILRCAQRTSTRDWAILVVGYWHGLRNQEIAKLRLNDIDWSSQTITVRRLKASLRTTQPIVKAKGKPELCEWTAVKAWLRERRSPSDYLFTSKRDDSSIGEKQMNRIFKKYLQMASAERVARGGKVIAKYARGDKNSKIGWKACNLSLHSLKHTRGSLAAIAGTNPLDIKMILGHKSLSSTERYVHPKQDESWRRNLRLELYS